MKMKIKCASSYLSDSRKIQSYLVKREESLVPREYKSPPYFRYLLPKKLSSTLIFLPSIVCIFNFTSLAG